MLYNRKWTLLFSFWMFLTIFGCFFYNKLRSGKLRFCAVGAKGDSAWKKKKVLNMLRNFLKEHKHKFETNKIHIKHCIFMCFVFYIHKMHRFNIKHMHTCFIFIKIKHQGSIQILFFGAHFCENQCIFVKEKKMWLFLLLFLLDKIFNFKYSFILL